MNDKLKIQFKWEMQDLAIVVGFLFLTLVVVYGLYTPFTLDDYQYALLYRQYGFLGALKERYLHWHGRFSSNFFIFLYHALGNIPRGVNFSVLINTLFLVLTFGLFQSRLVRMPGIKQRIVGLIVLTVFSITASPFIHSLLFSWSGSSAYVIGFFFAVLSLWCSDRMIRKASIHFWPINFVVMMIAAGMNEMNFIILILGNIFIWWGHYSKIDQQRWRQTALFNFFCISTAGLAVLLAPGNEVQLEAVKSISRGDFGTSMIGALNFPYYTHIKAIHLFLIFLGTVAYLCLNPRLRLKISAPILARLSLLVLLAFLCVHFAVYWNQGLTDYPDVVPARVSNILFLLLFFLLVISGVKVFDYLREKNKGITPPAWGNSFVLIFLLISAFYQGNGKELLKGLEQEIPQTIYYLDRAIHHHLSISQAADIHLSLPDKLIEENKIFPLKEAYHHSPDYWFNRVLSQYYHGQSIAFSFNRELEWLELIQNASPQYIEGGHLERFNKTK